MQGLRHLERERLDLVVAQVLEDARRMVRAERDQENGGLLAALESHARRAIGRKRGGGGLLGVLFEQLAHESLIHARTWWAIFSGSRAAISST